MLTFNLVLFHFDSGRVHHKSFAIFAYIFILSDTGPVKHVIQEQTKSRERDLYINMLVCRDD